jgi:rSAM/selenodomain-associated transferase 2
MPAAVSVIIPALDEEALVAQSVLSAFAAGASEVIVSDGGSSDRTAAEARGAGALVVTGGRVRGEQLNLGAAAARGPHLLFLHADTLLPPRGALLAAEALESGFTFGGFRIEFDENRPGLRFTAAMINARTALTREPWGDQGQFASRAAFDAAGGYRAIPIMDDYDFARRMRRGGRSVILSPPVTTSGRRFLERGYVRTTVMNWLLIAAWHLGVDPERLRRLYGRR